MMKILLKNKKEKPPFLFYVKENTSSFNYYAFVELEEAMNKAKILSLSGFPIAIVLEPVKNQDGEWIMKRTFVYAKGRCKQDDKLLLHAKFYTDAGECLNDKCHQNI